MKRCPFCGGSPTIMEGTKFSKIECSKCGSRTTYCSSIQEAVEIWDHRYRVELPEDDYYVYYHVKSDGPYPDIETNKKDTSVIKED